MVMMMVMTRAAKTVAAGIEKKGTETSKVEGKNEWMKE